MTTPSPDPDTLAYVAGLVQLERAGERAPLVVGPYTAFTLVGAIQLATRHPGLSDYMTRLLTEFGDQIIRGYFAGTPGEALLLAGWDPSHDVELDGGS